MTASMLESTPAAPASHHDADWEPCVIVGGGISGLALASWLASVGERAVVLDASPRAGGVMESFRESGFLFERGPNTVLDKQDSLTALIRWAGLDAEMIRVPLKGQARYVWHGGRLHEVPSGPGALLRSSLFTIGGKLSLLRELFVPAEPEEETLKAFITRRLGHEIYERAFLPMVQGIGAGDPARLGAGAAFPLLKEFERTHGGLIRGMVATMKAARKAGTRREVAMITFKDGLGRLPEALAARLGDGVRTGVAVERITQIEGGWKVEARRDGEPISLRARRVVIASPATAAADLIQDFEPATAIALRGVHYCPMAAVALGVRRDSLRLPAGFGFLAARDQGLRVLGSIFNSNFFPGRAPEGCDAMTVMLGGDLDPAALNLDDAALLEVVRNDLGRAFGWNGKHEVARVNRWPRAIPQYEMSHPALLSALESAERANAGLHFFGNWRGGVALQDRIELARRLAEQFSQKSINAGAAI